MYRTPLLLSFIVGSCLDFGRLFVLVLVVGSSRLVVVVAVLGVLLLTTVLLIVLEEPADHPRIPARTSRVFGCLVFPSDQVAISRRATLSTAASLVCQLRKSPGLPPSDSSVL